MVERTWLTVEVVRQARALTREAEATARILESIGDAFMAFDRDWRFTYVNDQSEKVMNRTREELLGRVFWEEFPATLGTSFETAYRRAAAEQVAVTFEGILSAAERVGGGAGLSVGGRRRVGVLPGHHRAQDAGRKGASASRRGSATSPPSFRMRFSRPCRRPCRAWKSARSPGLRFRKPKSAGTFTTSFP